LSEETLELRVEIEDEDVKDVVYHYIKTCEGQLDLRQCAVDLQVAVEDVLKAVALLEGEGRIKVEVAKSPITEAPPVVTETKEPEAITPATPSEEMWTGTLSPQSEEPVQPSIESPADVTPAETPQEQTSPPTEPLASTEKHEVTTIEGKEESPVEPTPIIQPEVTSEESPTEAPEPKPIEALMKEEATVEKPAEAPAEKPATQPSEPSMSPPISATPEPTAPTIKAPETQPPTPNRSIEPIVITEGQIILEKPGASKARPIRELQQIQQEDEPAQTIQATAVVPTAPLPEISRRAICPKCGLPTDTPLKQWSIKGRIAKKSVLLSLYKCSTCSTMFRSADTLEIKA